MGSEELSVVVVIFPNDGRGRVSEGRAGQEQDVVVIVEVEVEVEVEVAEAIIERQSPWEVFP